MNPKSQRPPHGAARCIALGLIALAATGMAVEAACPSAWNKPGGRFEGIDDFGYVFVVEEAGTLDLGEVSIPVYALFNSDWSRVSPYLGAGWELPLLESRMVQLDERGFRLHQPGGRYRDFWRTEPGSALLDGQGGWKAEIRGDIIEAAAPCGVVLKLLRGRLVEMRAGDSKLEFVRNGDVVTEIRDRGRTVLAVEHDPTTGEPRAITLFGGRRIGLEFTSRPLVEVVNGTRLVGSTARALSTLTTPDGTTTFDYTTDEKLTPALTIARTPAEGARKAASSADSTIHTATWHPATRLALTDGQWTYDITASETPDATAAIRRTNPQGQNEFWHKDDTKGIETVEGLDGVKKVTTRFTSGLLAGKLRSEIVQDNRNRFIEEKECAYDEQGNLIRMKHNGLTFTYSTEEPWRVSSVKIGRRALYTDGNMPVIKDSPNSQKQQQKK